MAAAGDGAGHAESTAAPGADPSTPTDPGGSAPRRSVLRAAAVGIALVVAASCSSSRPYDGPGRDHPFTDRSLDEVVPCQPAGQCGDVSGINTGTLDGTVVRVVDDLSEPDPPFVDLACTPQRVELIVDGDDIVAAHPQDCS